MRTPEQISEIISRLEAAYPLAECTLDWLRDYELLFSARLAAQCTDERVNKITPALFERFPSLEAFAAADISEVEDYVHSCGFYHAKAQDIVACAQMLIARYGGKVPGTMDELLTLPGVGVKQRTSSRRRLQCARRRGRGYTLHPSDKPDGPCRRP
jgi:endonuclease-3